MKLVIAIIEPQQLPAVKNALFAAQIHEMTVTNALGRGEEHKGYFETFRGVGHEVTLLKRLRLEIALNNDNVETAIDAILRGAHAGSDEPEGIVMVTDLPEFIRIRTKERGLLAL
ncbi:MAG: P-II family nitrogen regulator [Myxococcales bacterium]|nr:P-II family nitrogen regulator [Myxococcales bacterium]